MELLTDIEHGDIRREMAEKLIRQRRFTEAEACLDEAQLLYGNDYVHNIMIMTVRGQLAYASRDFKGALELHQIAQEYWYQTPAQDKGWMQRNNFHILRASVVLAYGPSFNRYDFWLIKQGPDQMLKRRAKLLHRLRWIALPIDQLLERYFSN
jgi:hypothetical protein